MGNLGATAGVFTGAISGSTTLNVTGNANVGNLGATAGVFTGAISGSTTLNVTGNANVGNIGSLHSIHTGNVTAGNINSVSGILSVSGNANVGNLGTAGLITATGNITGGNLVTGGTISATGNANVGNLGAARGVFSSTANSTSIGTGAVTVAGGIGIAGNAYIGGDININGNLFVSGNSTIVNANDITIADKTFVMANNASTGAAADGSGIITGNVSANAQVASLLFHNATTSWQSSVGITPITNATLNLGGVTNQWGNVYAANYYGTIATASQTNITAVGTLASLSVTGNANVGNLGATRGVFTNQVGTLETASQTNITAVGTLASLSVTGNANVGNLGATNIVGTLSTASQPNITSVGTLGSLSVTGNAGVGNLNLSGNIVDTGALALITAASGNITLAPNGSTVLVATTTGANITGTLNVTGNANVGNLGATAGVFTGAISGSTTLNITGNANVGNLGATNIVGTLSTAAQPNITSLGNLSAITVNGTSNLGAVGNVIITGGSSGQFLQTNGNGGLSFSTVNTSLISNGNSNVSIPVAGGNVNTSVGGVANVFVVSSTGANINGTANVTGLTRLGNTLTVNTGNVLTAIANGGTAGVGNIGAAGQGFDTLFARQASANYADLAEIYEADGIYEYGTVMIFGGSTEITMSTMSHDTRIAGVVSQQPAFLMNDTASGIPLALTGRVPCRVLGPVSKGTLLVSSHLPGIACALDPVQYQPGCVIGKSLTDVADDSIQLIEAVVGRL